MEIVWLILFLCVEMILALSLGSFLNFYVTVLLLVLVAVPFFLLINHSINNYQQKVALKKRSKQDSEIFKNKKPAKQ